MTREEMIDELTMRSMIQLNNHGGSGMTEEMIREIFEQQSDEALIFALKDDSND